MQEWFYQMYGFYPFELENGKFVKDELDYELFAISEDMSFLSYYENLQHIQRACNVPPTVLVENQFHEYISKYEDVSYVLVSGKKTFLSVNDILYMHDNTRYNYQAISAYHIRDKWISRSDHVEYDILSWLATSSLKERADVLNTYLALGYCENAIKYLLNIQSPLPACMVNKRLQCLECFQVFNPIYMTSDHEARDICALFKLNIIDYAQFIKIIQQRKYTKDELMYIVARLLFPSHFFDYIEEIYLNKQTSKQVYDFDQETKSIKELSNYIIINYNLPIINWML